MEASNGLNSLIDWLNAFNPTHIINEDDVETKFVLPLFRHLGYSDIYRRGKYPINDYQSSNEKRGRKPEIDQVYFSASETSQQSADTSLLIVEAKKPQEINLEDAIKQAKYYGNHLTPIFLVITNGYRFIVLKRHSYRSEEIVFDMLISQLSDNRLMTEIYDQLHFIFVKQMKENGADILAHTLYRSLMDISHRYPDLQDQLSKGDFKPTITREKRRLTVVKSKVAVKCDLPITFDEGCCSIEFSSIMRRGLKCHLTHAEILCNFLKGLGTDPHWNTRLFLKKTEQEEFKAILGQTSVILSKEEAYELCDAVDIVGQHYKDIIIEAANKLETWGFHWPISIDNEKGFELLTVKQWLWDLMKEFSYEFDYDHGNTNWHMFESCGTIIRVSHKEEPDHVILWPKGGDFSVPESSVDVLYVDSITYLYGFDHEYDSAAPLFEEIGPIGIWTATYTKTWLVQHFIPRVVSYYFGTQTSTPHLTKKQLQRLPFSIRNEVQYKKNLIDEKIKILIKDAISDFPVIEKVALAKVVEPKQLTRYVNAIQTLFHSYGVNIPATILRSYYQAFTELAQCANPASVEKMDYIRAKLGGIQRRQSGRSLSKENLVTYSDILAFLNQQVIRIHEVDYEHHVNADLISSVFGAILEDGVIHCNQKQLNFAKEALIPLWELYRFVSCFIDPIRYEY